MLCTKMNQQFTKYFTLTMAIFYVAIGFSLLFTNVLEEQIFKYRWQIGAVFLGYGLLRIFMFIVKYRRGE